MINILSSYVNFKSDLDSVILDLIENKGIVCPFNSNEICIDLRGFSLKNKGDYSIELLLDYDQACFLTESRVYNKNGLIFDHEIFFAQNSMEDICKALNVLQQH